MAKGFNPNQILPWLPWIIGGVAAYELYLNWPNISAQFQTMFTPQPNMYQQQGYICPAGGTPGPTGLCPNGQMAVNASQFNQLASMAGGCSDGSIVNPTTGRCANGTIPTPTMGYGTGLGGLGYPSTSVCNDGSIPNQVNGLCANGSFPTTVGTGVNNAMMNPYGAPQYVSPGITGGASVPGVTTFTDPTTGQTYDPTTGMLLTPGGSYTTPSLAQPYGSIFPQLQPLGNFYQPPPPNISSTNVCADQSTPDPNSGLCHDGTRPVPSGLTPSQIAAAPQPIATTISTPNQPSTGGVLTCADGSTPNGGICGNGQAPTSAIGNQPTSSPTGSVPVTTPTTSPAPVATTTTTTTPTTTTTTPTITAPGGTAGAPGGTTTTTTQHRRFGFANEGSMIAATAFGYRQRDSNQATVTSYSSVRPKSGNSPITTELFGRRFFPQNPIYVSGIR